MQKGTRIILQVPCPTCDGTGKFDPKKAGLDKELGPEIRPCPKCSGEGYREESEDVHAFVREVMEIVLEQFEGTFIGRMLEKSVRSKRR